MIISLRYSQRVMMILLTILFVVRAGGAGEERETHDASGEGTIYEHTDVSISIPNKLSPAAWLEVLDMKETPDTGRE